MPVTPVSIGDPVKIVDEEYQPHIALVTTVHGSFDHGVPSINVAYVSADATRHDPYGRQLERLSSLAHFDTGPSTMPRPGRYWTNV